MTRHISPFHANVANVLYLICKEFKVKVNYQTLVEQVSLHPDGPSMNAICDNLSLLNVDNIGTKLDADRIGDIPLPAIAHLESDNGQFVMIRKIENGLIEWTDSQNGYISEELDAFLVRWTGGIVLAEPTTVSGEVEFEANRRSYGLASLRELGVIVSLSLLCLLPLVYAISYEDLKVVTYVRYLAKIVGLLAAYLIITSEKHQNSILRQLCGRQNTCQTVFNSRQANIGGVVSFSELVPIFFLTSLLTLVCYLFTIDNYFLWAASVLSVTSIPFVLYSLYLQGVVLRKWCRVCLIVSVILISDLPFVNLDASSITFVGVYILLSAGAFLVSISLVLSLVTLYRQTAIVFPLKKELQEIKLSKPYLESLLNGEIKMPPFFDGMKSIVYGSPEASHTVTIVANVFCPPCAKAHRDIQKFLISNGAFKFQYVFQSGHPRSFAITDLILDSDDSVSKLDEWFEGVNTTTEPLWSRREPESAFTNSRQSMLHNRWAEIAGINETPSYYLNGRGLTRSFQLRDLQLLAGSISSNAESYV